MFSLHCGFYTFTVPKKKKLGKTWFLRFCQGFYLYDNLASRKKKMFFGKKWGYSWIVLNFAPQSLCLVKMFCSGRQENKNSRRQMPKLGWFVFKIIKPKWWVGSKYSNRSSKIAAGCRLTLTALKFCMSPVRSLTCLSQLSAGLIIKDLFINCTSVF